MIFTPRRSMERLMRPINRIIRIDNCLFRSPLFRHLSLDLTLPFGGERLRMNIIHG